MMRNHQIALTSIAAVVTSLTLPAFAGEPDGGDRAAPELAVGLIASTHDDSFNSIGTATISATGRVVFDADGTSIYKWEAGDPELVLSMFAAGLSTQQRHGDLIVVHGKEEFANDPLVAFTLDLASLSQEMINTGGAGITIGQFSIDETGGISFWKLGGCTRGQCTHLILEAASPEDPTVLASANGGEVLLSPVRDPAGAATLYVQALADGSLQLRIVGDPEPLYATEPGGVVSAPSIAEDRVALFINDPQGVLETAGVYVFELGESPTSADLVISMDGVELAPAAYTRPAINEHGDVAFTAIDVADGLEKVYLLPAGSAVAEVLLVEGDDVESLGGPVRKGLQALGLSDAELGSENLSVRLLFRAVVGPSSSETWTVIGYVGTEIKEPKEPNEPEDPQEPEPIECPADLTGDGVVDIFDLLDVLAAWGPCADPESCPADVTGDGVVDIFDLLDILASWGPCPE